MEGFEGESHFPSPISRFPFLIFHYRNKQRRPLSYYSIITSKPNCGINARKHQRCVYLSSCVGSCSCSRVVRIWVASMALRIIGTMAGHSGSSIDRSFNVSVRIVIRCSLVRTFGLGFRLGLWLGLWSRFVWSWCRFFVVVVRRFRRLLSPANETGPDKYSYDECTTYRTSNRSA